MRICIAGAGIVGRSIAKEMLANDHEVLLIERDRHAVQGASVPGAEWLMGDACELDTLSQAELPSCEVAIAATGDDKVNLVFCMLAKTEFAVPSTVARVNHPSNEWLFDDQWGVDIAVSTPRVMAALVEEAVSVGDLVQLMSFDDKRANLVELRLPAEHSLVGQRVGDVTWPSGCVLTAVVRDGFPHAPLEEMAFEAHDELLFVAAVDRQNQLRDQLRLG